MIRVGALDDEIAKIRIAHLPHDLIQLPFLAGVILVAILSFPFIVVLPEHVLEYLTDGLDFSLSDYDGFLGYRAIFLDYLLLSYADLFS